MADRRRPGLDEPLDRSPSLLHYDPDSFGRISERVARYIGSWNFIAVMTALICLWVAYNVAAPADWKADPYPFIFLTLLLSLQASYAAPLILLAQNREADRDRVQYAEDRDRTERLLADAEYLMREIASLRATMGEVATRDYLRNELRDYLFEEQRRLERKLRKSARQAESGRPKKHKPSGDEPDSRG